MMNKFIDQLGSSRTNPLKRRVREGEKYVEIPFALPSDIEKWIPLNRVSLEYEGKEDHADLMYVPLRRSESIKETVSNPNLGLVEVQVGRIVKLLGAEITYTPKHVERPIIHDERDRIGVLYSRQITRSMSFGEGLTRGDFLSRSAPVNTGKTVLADPRTGPVSPKVDAEWDTHISTFRFCLTNHL